MTPEDLIAFEKDLAACFDRGEIKAPMHMAGGNEHALLKIFESIRHEDWILTGWRSHYHCLLKGVPAAEVKDAILRGRSIALTFPEYRVLCSAIVGGIAPIAVGLAWAIKRRGGLERVHAFLGDMTLETGAVHEATKYAGYFDLPIEWWVEDNGLSVGTETRRAWGLDNEPNWRQHAYRYHMTVGHVGTGKFVRF